LHEEIERQQTHATSLRIRRRQTHAHTTNSLSIQRNRAKKDRLKSKRSIDDGIAYAAERESHRFAEPRQHAVVLIAAAAAATANEANEATTIDDNVIIHDELN
jgi:hypothetical protein